MTSKELAYQQIEQLVQRFEEQIHSYKKVDYNETLARRDFIDPFFKALGWDIDNSQGYAEAYRDVVHEDAIKVGGVHKAPDYCFRVGGTRKSQMGGGSTGMRNSLRQSSRANVS